MATTDENDEDSWIQTIAAETPLQDEEILYLRTIHQLFQSADTVRMIDVAKRLEQGTGKVSYWMKKLREKGILDTTPKGVITVLKPAQSKKDETKEEATEDCSAASVGSVEREDDFVVSADDVDGADDTGEELETPHEATESVQEENGLEPEAQEQPIEEEPDVIPEGPDSRSQRRRERPTEKMLEAIEEIRRRYPEGASEADMKALKQKNPDITWQILAGNAKRVLGKPLVPYLEDIGILRKENAAQQGSVDTDVAEPENDERVQRETEERAEREAEERARREAEEQAQREAEEQARREAIEAARQEKIRSIKSQIDDLKVEMNATGGLFGAFKRKKIQAAIDELTDQLNKME